MRGRTVLITGATGFLGRHLLQAMTEIGPEFAPVALVRDAASWEQEAWQRALGPIPAVTGSILAPEGWQDDPRLDGLAGIVHLAATVRHSRRDSDEMVRTNIEGTLAMVRLAARYRCRLVFVSTSGTVGCFKTLAEAADETAPYCLETVKDWPYYRSKIEAEMAARRLADELGVDLVIIRPPILLGPGDHRARSTVNVLRVLRRKVPFLLTGGMHYIDVRDAAAALVRALQHPTPRPVYHLCGTASTLADFFRQVAEIGQVPLPTRYVPNGLVWLLATVNQALGSPLRLLPDPVVVEMGSHYWGLRSRYAAEDLAYHPRPGEETLRDTVAWLCREHGLPLPAEPAGP